MAMTIGINIPPTPSAGNSPTSDGSSNPPRTPGSPNMQTVTIASSDLTNLNSVNTQMKRKPSRRANTAERRATHNAVERQRRETLNGRFLDLAALLPNLSQIRRPSKSSIVNSSIAHVHASRRHRQLASRELRLLKLETDALRRELNEWRDRARLPHVEEPVRGEGFTMVLSGEIEVLAAIPDDEDDNHSGQGGFDGFDDGEDDFGVVSAGGDDERNNVPSLPMINTVNTFANGANGNQMSHLMARSTSGPMIVSPTNVSFENPAMASLYESNHPSFNGGVNYLQQQQQQQQLSQQDIEKWNSQMFSQQPLLPQRSLFTPPTTAHGLSPTATGVGAQGGQGTFTDSASHFFANYQRQQQRMSGHVYSSPELDDGSSIGSGGGGGRERRGSFSNASGSGYGTPPRSSPGSFDLGSGGEYVRAYGSVDGLGMGMGGGVGVKQGLTPISVGGGGNGGGFAMMMM